MSDPDVRLTIADDFERIVQLERACFKGPLAYSRRQLQYLVFNANSTVLVEEADGIIRGFIIVLYRSGTTVAGIETVNVDPSFRNQGVGTRLLAKAEEDIRGNGVRRIRLEVSTANKPAIDLYERAGFKKTGLLEDYYAFSHNGSRDAIRMIKELE
jgi:ribosomal protein S18 acetylase RimI-like enzyme